MAYAVLLPCRGTFLNCHCIALLVWWKDVLRGIATLGVLVRSCNTRNVFFVHPGHERKVQPPAVRHGIQ